MRSPLRRPAPHPRGMTLVEMLVALALLILMMTVIVQIFQAATTTLSASRVYQDLDSQLRQLDSTLRQDLNGVTASLLPPLDPKKNAGYFEYGENEFADVQGEDSDDYIRFTAEAPEGMFFTGHLWPITAPGTATNLPISIQSKYAEIIYFLRNGNLYRRVLLIAPEHQSAINAYFQHYNQIYSPAALGSAVSWLAVNDLSAHPAVAGNPNATGTPPAQTIILNTLGDVTNRHNRYAYPRFANDYSNNKSGAVGSDGVADDLNSDGSNIVGDGVADYYPTLYTGVFSPSNSGRSNKLVNEVNYPSGYAPRIASYDTMAFPYIYPGAYSQPEAYSANSGLGWIHSPSFYALTSGMTAAQQLAAQNSINHSPLDIGDGPVLGAPSSPSSWWGFPTWRETLSTAWTDPYFPVQTFANSGGAPLQPMGLSPLDPTVVPPPASPGGNFAWLPPLNDPTVRPTLQPYCDGYGSATFVSAAWGQAWEDDLIMTNVRSFDVKAYDNAYGGYVDLGWASDVRLWNSWGVALDLMSTTTNGTVSPDSPLLRTPPLLTWPPRSGLTWSFLYDSMGHEGRMPPRTTDGRADPQSSATLYPTLPHPQHPSPLLLNVGDDNAGVLRLRRVWDSWSTDYANAPQRAYDPKVGTPVGTSPYTPVYPSYEAPYPAALRGIQIQVRVTDPRNERLKVLTIRQDFVDKIRPDER